MSPLGGSTLMTSAPKSAKITAAPGPAMKLARSKTFNPEKILSVAIYASVDFAVPPCLLSSPTKLRHALFQESRCAFILVFRRSAQAEIGRFEQQALALARLQTFVHCFEGKLDCDRAVRRDLLQDCLGASDQLSRRHNFIDEPDAIGLLRADHLSGKNA